MQLSKLQFLVLLDHCVVVILPSSPLFGTRVSAARAHEI